MFSVAEETKKELAKNHKQFRQNLANREFQTNKNGILSLRVNQLRAVADD